MKVIYLDESKARGYIVAAVLVDSSDAAAARRLINSLRLNGQSRIHMLKENDRRRRQIVSAIATLKISCQIYRVEGQRESHAREMCLRAVFADAVRLGVTRLVLERDDSFEAFDRRVLSRASLTSTTHPVSAKPTFEHQRAVTEPLLCIPDAIAWCVSRGGQWQKRADAVISCVVSLTSN